MSQKVAIVTGSSSGIGRTTAVALAKEGIKVVIAARRDKEGEETLGLVKESGGNGIFVKTDVSNEDSVMALVEETVKRYSKSNNNTDNTNSKSRPPALSAFRVFQSRLQSWNCRF